jgi:hypothetical protein
MGSQFSVKIEEQSGNNWNQSCGALLTYMRRYSAMSLYSFFPVDEDTDGITTGEKAARELKKKKAREKKRVFSPFLFCLSFFRLSSFVANG